MLKFLWFIIALPPLFSMQFPVEKRLLPKQFAISVIIPCDSRHFEHLFPLLEHFQNQKVLPDELVISLSGINDSYQQDLYALESYPWPFSIKIITHEEKKTAGENRNIAAQNAFGDILICQDADDLPHPQRVEIVKYIFQNYNIDHLFHEFLSYHKSFTPYKPEEVYICSFSSMDEMFDYCYKNKHLITNGNVSFTREIGEKFAFPLSNVGEDTQFNTNIVSSSYTSAVVFAKLLMYRAYLSTNSPGFSWPEDIDF